MLDLALKVVQFVMSLWNLWDRLPPKIKRKIIDLIVAGFEEVFRAYYQSHKKS